MYKDKLLFNSKTKKLRNSVIYISSYTGEKEGDENNQQF